MRIQPTKRELIELFIRKTGYQPNVDNPVTFNEKLLHRKVYGAGAEKSLIVMLTDKLKARLYVEQYLDERPHPILLIPCAPAMRDRRPRKYPVVLKPNNKSGQTKIVRNARDWRPTYDRIMRLKAHDYGWQKGEWNYAEVEFEIFVEMFIPQFTEFHLYCFSGEVGMVLVVDPYEHLPDRPTSRGPNGMSLFRPNGALFMAGIEDRPVTHSSFPVPRYIVDRMVGIAEEMTRQLSFVRVDFLVTPEHKIYFSEFTFFPASGHYRWHPREFDAYLGGFWK